MFKINVLALGVVLHLTEVQVLHSLIIFIVIDLFYRTIESTQTNPARAYFSFVQFKFCIYQLSERKAHPQMHQPLNYMMSICLVTVSMLFSPVALASLIINAVKYF